MTVNPYTSPAAYACDLARLRELTSPHLPQGADPAGAPRHDPG
jgi:hypothetical protein